ncbi:MAG: hypothetical protein V4555_17790 [Acidobacteriota bacterium]
MTLALPLRLDFAGGWLDVPRYAIPGAFVVNCAISPLVTMVNRNTMSWDGGEAVPEGSGLGGSAAWRMLQGRDVIAEELAQGCGWQDPSILLETGLCVWASGPEPVLVHKDRGDWLRGHMALYWTGKTHDSSMIAGIDRDYREIEHASVHAAKAVQYRDLVALGWGVNLSYMQQRDEGMLSLPLLGLARKYCGAGHGGYAVYLFEDQAQRDAAVKEKGFMAVEPYCK